MKTFKEFISEGKNKDHIRKQDEKLRKEIKKPKIKKAANKILKGIQQERKRQIESGEPLVTHYGHSEPNSQERLASIAALMKDNREYLRSLRKNQP